jgi:hypothetical protein
MVSRNRFDLKRSGVRRSGAPPEGNFFNNADAAGLPWRLEAASQNVSESPPDRPGDQGEASTAAIAVTQGELRETHLKYHLSTADILSAGQMRRYAELRGYAGHQMRHQH